MENYELIIIGAGAAGLSAGIYAARSGLKTLIIEEKLAGGTTADAPTVENYPGYAQIGGAELAEKMTTHCRKTGVTINELETVTALNLQGEKKTVTTTRAEYEANAIIIATGSEVDLAIKAQAVLAAEGVNVRVVSMPSTNVFDRQDQAYKDSVLPKGIKRVAVEAGVTGLWYKYVGLEGAVIGMDCFGESAPAPELFKHFGFTVENVVKTVKGVL